MSRGWLWVVVFVATRAVMLARWDPATAYLASDVEYYWANLAASVGDGARLVEYPLPAVWLLHALAWPAHDAGQFVAVHAVAMIALEGLFAALLHRRGGSVPVAFWIAFTTCFGVLDWFRMDLVAAVAVGIAALELARRPRVAGAALFLGAALKLWPALLIAPLMGVGRAARDRLVAFAATGVAVVAAALLLAGPARLLSPVSWQAGRGLQIESVAATWPMWRRAGGAPYGVEFSAHQAYEITGPGVAGWATVATVLTGLVLVSALGFAVLAWTGREPAPATAALALVALVAGLLVANKTFSPQYLVWLAAPVAALLVHARAEPARRPVAYALAAGLVALALVTAQVYPTHYVALISPQTGDRTATAWLVARNVLLVGVAVLAQAGAWRAWLGRRADIGVTDAVGG